MKSIKELKVVVLGTGPLAENLLITLCEGGLVPKMLITKPDSKSGRGHVLSEPTIKVLARTLNIKCLQPENLSKIPEEVLVEDFDLFIVASYGKIIPDNFLEIPAFGTINIHPSLLPKYRGPTPIETSLLNGDEELGISIMFLDSEIDHGPILLQRSFDDLRELPTGTTELFERLAGVYGGSLLLTEVLIPFTQGSLVALEQNHSKATFTRKFKKSDGQISLDDDIYRILKVFRACSPWPGCYFIHNTKNGEIRVKITDMQIDKTGLPYISKVIPQGKKEMDFESFRNGYLK